MPTVTAATTHYWYWELPDGVLLKEPDAYDRRPTNGEIKPGQWWVRYDVLNYVDKRGDIQYIMGKESGMSSRPDSVDIE